MKWGFSWLLILSIPAFIFGWLNYNAFSLALEEDPKLGLILLHPVFYGVASGFLTLVLLRYLFTGKVLWFVPKGKGK